MDTERTTQILKGVSLGLIKIIEIFSIVILGGILGMMKATSNITPIKQKIDKIKQLTDERDQI